MKSNVTKSELINRIIAKAKNAAFLANKPFNDGDIFFSLIFRDEKELLDLCNKMQA